MYIMLVNQCHKPSPMTQRQVVTNWTLGCKGGRFTWEIGVKPKVYPLENIQKTMEDQNFYVGKSTMN